MKSVVALVFAPPSAKSNRRIVSQPVRATIRDVAKAAGVSATTVSHALNGKGVVKAATVERIHAIATQLGYRPNVLARGMRHQHLGLIGLIIRPFDGLDTFMPPGVDYFLRITGFASLTAMEYGYGLMIINNPSRESSPVSASAADIYVVVEPYENDAVLTYLTDQRIPFVTIGPDIARPDSFISMDTRAGEQITHMLNFLQDRGAQNIAMLTGSDRNAWNTYAKLAYRDWTDSNGQPFVWTEVPEATGEHAADVALDALIAANSGKLPDAIFCLMGRKATGIAQAAAARGIRIPEELQIAAGSGSLQNQTQQPTVTAYDLQPEILASAAVKRAIQQLEGKEVTAPFVAPDAILHERQSTRR